MPLGFTLEARTKLTTTIREALDDHSNTKRSTWLRDYVAILLGLEAGLRTSEVTHLKISDVWFNGDAKPWLHIPENFNKHCKEGMIPLSRNLTETLRVYIPLRLTWLKEGEIDGWLISNKPGKRKKDQPLGNPAMFYMVDFWAKKAGLPHFRFHDLRHTFATFAMAADNSNLRIVQDLLRHRQIASTQVYTHPTHAQIAMVIDKAFNQTGEKPL